MKSVVNVTGRTVDPKEMKERQSLKEVEKEEWTKHFKSLVSNVILEANNVLLNTLQEQQHHDKRSKELWHLV